MFVCPTKFLSTGENEKGVLSRFLHARLRIRTFLSSFGREWNAVMNYFTQEICRILSIDWAAVLYRYDCVVKAFMLSFHKTV